MPPHPLVNFEIQKYYQNEPRFNGAYSRDNLPQIKDGAYIINLDEYSDIGTHWFALYINPIQDDGVPKSPTSFPPVTSTNEGFGPQNFLAFRFNPFATLVQSFKFVPTANSKLLNLNQDHPSRKAIFLVKPL